jgi:transposase
MEIFLHSLAQRLDRERPEWRTDTILLFDNAPYHVCDATLKIFEKLRMPLLFTGPHSFDAAPAELMFAAFKVDDINPRKVKTGKT